jgi:hypothetical protein
MNDTRQSVNESQARVVEMEKISNEIRDIDALLRDDALNAAHLSEEQRKQKEALERQRAELLRLQRLQEEQRRAASMTLCGVCGRANTPTSGCGFRGNSPIPITIDVGTYNRRFV